jgi:hypothetical protein
MGKAIRRVVTGHDRDGKPIVLADGPAPNVQRRSSGIVSTLAWVTDATPADIVVRITAARRYAASSVDFKAFVQGTRIKGASRPRRRALPCRKIIVLPS